MQKLKLANKNDVEKIKEIFLKNYPNSVTELNFRNLYELLVSVMLSAQCTDKRVNIITPKLFERFPDIKSLSKADINDVKELIKSCSFFNNKAKNLVNMAKMVVKEFKGEIPLNQKDLMKLAGVGQKTANVVLIEYANENLMAVDTHVFRVSHRLGLSSAKKHTDVERDLTEKFESDLNRLHQAMVLFGRYRCKALNPQCKGCILEEFCVADIKKDRGSR